MCTRTAGQWLSLGIMAGASVMCLVTPSTGQEDTFDGAALYRTYCASCHGVAGRGDGPVAGTLKRRPADLTQITKRNNGAFPAGQLFRIIDGRQTVKAHGDSQMPVWGDAFARTVFGADEESVRQKIHALVKYLSSIQERNAAATGNERSRAD
jgi:mono/diheme cytochrome c family protein